MYFDSKTAMRLTGVTRTQLAYWDKGGIARPSMPAAGRGSRRLYTFRDLVQLRVANRLKDRGLSLQRLRKALVYLRRQFPVWTMGSALELGHFVASWLGSGEAGSGQAN